MVKNTDPLQIVFHRSARDGERLVGDHAQRTDRFHNRLDASGRPEVFDVVGARGAQLAEIGGLRADPVEEVEIELDPRLVSDSRKMKDGVR